MTPSLHTRHAARTGFTLVEILITVVIIAILAAMVIPQFTSAADESRDKSMQMSLYRVRQQLQLYQQQHGSWPALATLEAQLTQASDEQGNTATPGTAGYIYGPYLKRFPVNPATDGDTVGDGAAGTSDWYYNETTGDFHANDSADSRAF